MTEEEKEVYELRLEVCRSELLLTGKYTPAQAAEIAPIQLRAEDAAGAVSRVEMLTKRVKRVQETLDAQLAAARITAGVVETPKANEVDDIFSKLWNDAMKHGLLEPQLVKPEYAARMRMVRDEPESESFAHKFRQFLKL